MKLFEWVQVIFEGDGEFWVDIHKSSVGYRTVLVVEYFTINIITKFMFWLKLPINLRSLVEHIVLDQDMKKKSHSTHSQMN